MNDNIVSYVLSLFDATPTPLLVFLIFGVSIFILVNVMALIGGLGTYAERKISADIQMRQGSQQSWPVWNPSVLSRWRENDLQGRHHS